ncbi:MAG: DNA primase [Chlorobi bacterium]|nr:DNA primase [Chlorobiota bacterium]
MGRIPEHIIEQIRETARVEEVIGEFVELKRAGSNLKGFSPFNSERTPSFMVSPAKQIWKDFSSGKGGDVVKFLMEHEGMSYPEALRWLAKKYHIDIPETGQRDEEAEALARKRDSLYAVLDFAKNWFIEQLYDTDEGRSVGLSYFRERGFLEKTLKDFDIGYAPEGFDTFYRAARAKGFKDDILEDAGLIIRKNNRIIDRFYGRVIFPIHRLSGNVVAFAGRILDTSKHKAKYINSPETEVYNKSKILYGIHKAKAAISREKNAYLVEGYTDVLSFYQAGLENTVASAGTALTADQVKLIKRFTPNITLVYDGDPAGLKAAIRGVDIILENDMNVKVVVLPEGDDPDSFAKKVSTEELIAYLETHSKDFIRFAAEVMLKDATDPIQTYEMVRHVIESIAKIPNEIKRELFVREVAALSGIDERKLFAELSRQLQKIIYAKERHWRSQVPQPRMQVVEDQPRPLTDRLQVLERDIIKLLILYGDQKALFPYYFTKDDINGEWLLDKEYREVYVWEKIYQELTEDEIQLSHPVFKRLYDAIMNEYLHTGSVDWEQLRTKLSEEETEVLADIFFEKDKYRLSDWEKKRMKNIDPTENLSVLVTDIIYHLRLEWLQRLIDEQAEKLQKGEEDSEESLEEIMQYNKLKKFLARIVNRVV